MCIFTKYIHTWYIKDTRSDLLREIHGLPTAVVTTESSKLVGKLQALYYPCPLAGNTWKIMPPTKWGAKETNFDTQCGQLICMPWYLQRAGGGTLIILCTLCLTGLHIDHLGNRTPNIYSVANHIAASLWRFGFLRWSHVWGDDRGLNGIWRIETSGMLLGEQRPTFRASEVPCQRHYFLLDPQVGGTTIFRNFGNYSLNDTG